MSAGATWLEALRELVRRTGVGGIMPVATEVKRAGNVLGEGTELSAVAIEDLLRLAMVARGKQETLR